MVNSLEFGVLNRENYIFFKPKTKILPVGGRQYSISRTGATNISGGPEDKSELRKYFGSFSFMKHINCKHIYVYK